MLRWCGFNNDHLLRILQVFASLLAGYFVCYSITDGDLFWHLAAGREMFARHGLLFLDPFSYTTPDARWIDLHWLFQATVYLLDRFGGLRLLLLFKALAVAGAVGLIITAFPRSPRTAAVALSAAVIIYCQRYLVPMRPVIVTLMLTGLFIASLEYYCRTGKPGALLPVLIGQIAWVNSQGLFMLGPAIAASYGIGEPGNLLVARRFPERFLYRTELTPSRYLPLLLLPLALIAVSLINPYGRHAFSFAAGLFARITPASSNLYSRAVIENMPLIRMVGTEYASYAAAVVAVIAAVLISLIYSFRTVRLAHCVLAAAGLLLAVMAQRNGILFTLLALPALLWNLHHAPLPVKTIPVRRSVTRAVILLFVGYAAANHTRLLITWPHTLSPFSHPTESAKLLKASPLPGNLFNADRYGGFLLWKLYPPRRVSHDTRLTLRTKAFFREYLGLIENPARFDGYARRWGITHIALPVAPIDLYLPLAAALYCHPGWNLAFTDGTEVLFVADSVAVSHGIDLDSLQVIDAITRSLKTRFGPSPTVYDEALMWLGRWCAAAGAYSGARRALAHCRSISGRTMRAAIEERQGFVEDAERLLRSILDNHPRNSDVRLQLALLYLRTGRRREGLDELTLLLKKDPFNKAARKVLFRLSAKTKVKP
ncbi:MAG: tetratricopeptide repeat protein [Chitinispirillaceae bacterium]|nr:tetratricopeptide repeat protein [Chitinispirillaceae bacterium]